MDLVLTLICVCTSGQGNKYVLICCIKDYCMICLNHGGVCKGRRGCRFSFQSSISTPDSTLITWSQFPNSWSDNKVSPCLVGTKPCTHTNPALNHFITPTRINQRVIAFKKCLVRLTFFLTCRTSQHTEPDLCRKSLHIYISNLKQFKTDVKQNILKHNLMMSKQMLRAKAFANSTLS